MTDKKPTDAEIVKALNQCACSETNCYGCPYWDASNCSDRLCMDALDLINRLQAENERLQEEVELLHSDYTYKIVKIKAKAEAYKEFAEKVLKDLTLLAKHEDEFRRSVILGVCNTIKFKLKELVGDK